MLTRRLILPLLSVLSLAQVYSQDLQDGEYRLVCYHTNWAQYRQTPAKFTPDNIDPQLCTHIIYSFAKIQNGLLTPYEWNDESTDWSVGNYEKFTNLKSQNPDLKLLLAVGGWTHRTEPFTELINSDDAREQFITHAILFLRNRNFDGLDLDWEFPAARGSPPNDKQGFTVLCKELRAAFQADADASGLPHLLLTAAVAAGYTYIDAGYEISKVTQELDFVNLMAYDLHGSWKSQTGHHTTLYPSEQDSEQNAKLTVQFAVNKWLAGECPPRKLNVGMGVYGRGFTLAGSGVNIGAPAKGPSTKGPYTREGGFLAYHEICQKLASGYTRGYDDERKVPYAYGDGQWVGYDDEESLREKVNFIKTKGLGGGMIWAMDLDDFTGNSCGQGPWPLLSAIRGALDQAATTTASSITTRNPTTTATTTADKPTTSADSSQYTTKQAAASTPTTSAPTTSAPTTSAPTTSAPTTSAPTTSAPPTSAPTTSAPTTSAPTTSAPTTLAPTTPTAPTTSAPTTTAKPTNGGNGGGQSNGAFSCNGQDGLFPDPTDCSSFYQCYGGAGQNNVKKHCPSDLVFNPNPGYCDWTYTYNCVPSNPASTTTGRSTTSVPTTTTSHSNTGNADVTFSCNGQDGLFSDPNDCGSYYNCWGGGQFYLRFTCPTGTVFNPNKGYCDWPYNYQCP